MTLRQFCFSFTGRIDRTSYWGYAIISIFVLLVVALTIEDMDDTTGKLMAGIVFLKVLFMDIAVTVKRLHDTNRSGWCILIGSIPIIGCIYLFIVCGCLRGTEGDNRYDSPPHETTLENDDRINRKHNDDSEEKKPTVQEFAARAKSSKSN